MKHKDLLVGSGNWDAVKKTVPGLEEAARGLYRARPTFIIDDIRIFDKIANYEDSMRSLKEDGLRPMTYQEALSAIDKHIELKVRLAGKWFWVDGRETRRIGYYTFQPDGSLRQGKSDDPERTVFIFKGSQQLSFGVDWDEGAGLGGRFTIGQHEDPSSSAEVVVGVTKDMPVNSICKQTRRGS